MPLNNRPPHVVRLPVLVAGFLVVGPLAAGCADGPADRSAPVAHLAACVERAPDRPCEPLAGHGADYWLAQQSDRTTAYLDAAEVCLGALLRGEVAGRRGACVDVHQAYVADARSGPRDLDGRLGADQAGRAFGLAYSAVVAERSRRTAESMTADPPTPDR